MPVVPLTPLRERCPDGHFPADALRFKHLMLGDLAAQRRQIEHLAGLDHRRRTHRAITSVALARRGMCFNPIRLRHAPQGMTHVSRLSSRRLLALGSQRLRRGLFNPSVDGGWLELRRFFARRPCGSSTVAVSATTRTHNASIRASLLGQAQGRQIGQGFHGRDYPLLRRLFKQKPAIPNLPLRLASAATWWWLCELQGLDHPLRQDRCRLPLGSFV